VEARRGSLLSAIGTATHIQYEQGRGQGAFALLDTNMQSSYALWV
jgi:hypothetical protein